MRKLSLIKDIQENTLSEHRTTESVEKYDLEMVKLNNWGKESIEKLKQSDFFI